MDSSQDSQSHDLPLVTKRRFWQKRWVKIVGALAITLILITGLAAWQVNSVYVQALSLRPTIEKVQGNLKSQDLPALTSSLTELRQEIAKLQSSYGRLKWAGFIPLAGAYWRDGESLLLAGSAGVEASQVLVSAIEPYADILGFQGSGSFTGGTVEDRIVIALETLDKITPKLDEVSEKLAVVDQNLQKINPERYQRAVIQGRNIAEDLAQLQEVVHGTALTLTNARPALRQLPNLAGMDRERKYMILFHNDGELRGTGGFMTAYGVLRVEKGHVQPEKSSDIYDLDAKFNSRLAPPEPIKKYLRNVPYWYLRDMNLSPDFKLNMDTFYQYYQTIKSEPKIDGIIGIDTNFLVELLKILGPIDVPGYGRFTVDTDPRCNCPQVVYQLELIADRPVATLVDNRKSVLGPLMKELITRAYNAPTPWWDDLAKAIGESVTRKHVVFYFPDQALQEAAEGIRAAGRLEEVPTDYFQITDVNFSGGKANFFVTQDMKQKLTIESDGTIVKTITITYTNPEPGSNCNLEAGQLCLNAPMPNFVRVFVPLGSELVESLGFDEPVIVKQELGKTVFEGFLKVNPQSTAKTIYTYRLPWKAGEVEPKFLIQKQVGKDTIHVQAELPDRVEEFDLTGDKLLSFSWE